MSMAQLLVVLGLLGLLVIAVAIDVNRHRIPNSLLLLGLSVCLISRLYGEGLDGLTQAGWGLLVGFALFMPMYLLGGMAAGDVKLMAVVGSFLSPQGAMWAALFSVLAGSLIGLLMIVLCGQLGRTLSRYLLMARSRSYLSPEANEVSTKAFPYSVAILIGTLTSLYWLRLSQ